MDEPFGALDAITRAALQDELLSLWRRTGKTILFVTHDIDEAIYLADRIIVHRRIARAGAGNLRDAGAPASCAPIRALGGSPRRFGRSSKKTANWSISKYDK